MFTRFSEEASLQNTMSQKKGFGALPFTTLKRRVPMSPNPYVFDEFMLRLLPLLLTLPLGRDFAEDLAHLVANHKERAFSQQPTGERR